MLMGGGEEEFLEITTNVTAYHDIIHCFRKIITLLCAVQTRLHNCALYF